MEKKHFIVINIAIAVLVIVFVTLFKTHAGGASEAVYKNLPVNITNAYLGYQLYQAKDGSVQAKRLVNGFKVNASTAHPNLVLNVILRKAGRHQFIVKVIADSGDVVKEIPLGVLNTDKANASRIAVVSFDGVTMPEDDVYLHIYNSFNEGDPTYIASQYVVTQ